MLAMVRTVRRRLRQQFFRMRRQDLHRQQTRVAPGALLSLPMTHKAESGKRSHFLTASFQIADAPGPDDNVQPPLAQEDGVIKPPPTGDEGIHTEVPNPNAGPRDEIAPPPQLPGSKNAQPK